MCEVIGQTVDEENTPSPALIASLEIADVVNTTRINPNLIDILKDNQVIYMDYYVL